jgi:hypothetical protein
MLAAVLALALQDLSAEQLTEALRRGIENARTIRVEMDVAIRADRPEACLQGRSTTLIKGADRWSFDFRVTEGGSSTAGVSARFDGRKTRIDASYPLSLEPLKAGEIGPRLREELWTGVAPAALMPRVDGKPAGRTFGKLRDGGVETIDGKRCQGLRYDVQTSWGEMRVPSETVTAYVDPKALRPVLFEGRGPGQSWKATIRVFAIDEPLDDAAFAPQSPRDLDRAFAGQAARAAALFALFCGRLPRSLEELVRRPADLPPDVFYPEGGFVLDGRVPPVTLKDGAVVRGDSAVRLDPASGRAVGAPSERLRLHYAARVRLRLLASAVEAYRDAAGGYPRKAADLWTCEPPWLPGGKLPDDPWGRPFRLITETGRARVQIQDPKERRIPLKELTADERAGLEAAALPRLSEEEKRAIARLLDQAADDDLETRETARNGLKARGAAPLPFLEERLKATRDVDALRWLKEARAALPRGTPAWLTELAALSVMVRRGPVEPAGSPDEGERRASASLKTISSAQADFRANDRDENKINDFWTGDIAGLYAVKTADGEMIKLIEVSVAAADAAPLAVEGPWGKLDPEEAQPDYRFQAMLLDRSTDPPEAYRQDTEGVRKMGIVHHHAKFGACAFPAEYGVSGLRTYIINEGNTVFWRDTGGEAALEWPSDAELARDWKKLE